MPAEEKEILQYKGGVEEGQGRVPLWLTITCISLAAWGAYYMFKNRGGLGPGRGN